MQLLSAGRGTGARPGRAPRSARQSGLDEIGRAQVALAARMLRSVSPADGEIEIALHEIARRLEQIAEAGAAPDEHGQTPM